MAKVFKRTDGQARINRDAAQQARERGQDAVADRLEAQAKRLESGQVTDQTDNVSALFRAIRRR